MEFTGDYCEIQAGAELFARKIGGQALSEVQLDIQVIKKQEPGLSVELKEQSAAITYGRKVEFFRAFSLLCAHAGEKEYRVEETPEFETNGCMIDCSRNAVLRVGGIKEIIRRMAALGLDNLMLYTEDTYEVEGHPYFGAYRGRYTKEELKECDDYADLFGIEIIPCIQTLAHLHNMLKWPEFSELQDTKDVILVGEPKTYQLIREMITAASAPFRSKKIHLGMDEAQQLGFGQYYKKNGYRPARELMQEHLDAVYGICEELGLSPMIWSDVYITENTGLNYYETPEDVDTTDWLKPPKDLGLVYWDYYHHEPEIYRNNLRAHMQISDEVTFAGGSWIWNGVAPNLSKAVDSSIVALQTCKELGIRHVVSTHWQDNGAETPVEAGYPIMTLFAEMGYGHEPEEAQLEEAYKRCFFASYADFMLLNEFDFIDKENIANKRDDTPSKYLLYQDVMLGIFDKQIEGYDISGHYRKLADRLKPAQQRNKPYESLFAYYQTLAEVLYRKGNMGVRLKQAYDRNDEKTLLQIAEKEIPECCQYVEELRRKRRDIWMSECKAFGYELLDIRIGGVAVRLQSAADRIQDYLSGRVECLEELEEPRLLYRYRSGGVERELCWESFWQKIISGSDLNDTI